MYPCLRRAVQVPGGQSEEPLPPELHRLLAILYRQGGSRQDQVCRRRSLRQSHWGGRSIPRRSYFCHSMQLELQARIQASRTSACPALSLPERFVGTHRQAALPWDLPVHRIRLQCPINFHRSNRGFSSLRTPECHTFRSMQFLLRGIWIPIRAPELKLLIPEPTQQRQLQSEPGRFLFRCSHAQLRCILLSEQFPPMILQAAGGLLLLPSDS